jgi:hypothetical protein
MPLTQLYLPLVQIVTFDQGHSLICIPDRDTAECELTKLRRQYGPRLIKATIRKVRPGKGSTYTLRYFTRETSAVNLF